VGSILKALGLTIWGSDRFRIAGSAIEYGQQLVDESSAGPADLSIVAQSYSSISDCGNAQIWAQKAKDAFQKAGLEPDEALRRIAACCVSGRDNPRIVLDSAQRARRQPRVDRLSGSESFTTVLANMNSPSRLYNSA
jgi:hypothetical protein